MDRYQCFSSAHARHGNRPIRRLARATAAAPKRACALRARAPRESGHALVRARAREFANDSAPKHKVKGTPSRRRESGPRQPTSRWSVRSGIASTSLMVEPDPLPRATLHRYMKHTRRLSRSHAPRKCAHARTPARTHASPPARMHAITHGHTPKCPATQLRVPGTSAALVALIVRIHSAFKPWGPGQHGLGCVCAR
jgi:hypothetical protein